MILGPAEIRPVLRNEVRPQRPGLLNFVKVTEKTIFSVHEFSLNWKIKWKEIKMLEELQLKSWNYWVLDFETNEFDRKAIEVDKFNLT